LRLSASFCLVRSSLGALRVAFGYFDSCFWFFWPLLAGAGAGLASTVPALVITSASATPASIFDIDPSFIAYLVNSVIVPMARGGVSRLPPCCHQSQVMTVRWPDPMTRISGWETVSWKG